MACVRARCAYKMYVRGAVAWRLWGGCVVESDQTAYINGKSGLSGAQGRLYEEYRLRLTFSRLRPLLVNPLTRGDGAKRPHLLICFSQPKHKPMNATTYTTTLSAVRNRLERGQVERVRLQVHFYGLDESEESVFGEVDSPEDIPNVPDTVKVRDRMFLGEQTLTILLDAEVPSFWQ